MTTQDQQVSLNKQLHSTRADFGSSLTFTHKVLISAIERYHQLKQITSVLDYGTGKGLFPAALRDALPALNVACFDPSVDSFSHLPHGQFDLVTSLDVLEHIDHNLINGTLDTMFKKTAKLCYLQIDLQPAVKRLADGRNAHVLLAPPSWWIGKVSEFFPTHSSFCVFHTSGALHKVCVIGAVHHKYAPLVWSLSTKLDRHKGVLTKGYIDSK